MAVPKRVTKGSTLKTATGKKAPTSTKSAPTKKKGAGSGNQEMSPEEFTKMMKSKQKVLDRSKVKDAPSGFVEDAEVIKRLGLKVGKGTTAKAKFTSAKIVKVDGTPIFKCRFVVQDEGEAQGLPLQQDFWLPINDDEALEKSLDSIVFMLQKMGYDVKELTVDQLPQIASELTEEKPVCVVYVNCYKGKSGKSKGKLKYGLRVNSAVQENEESEEEDEEEELEEEEEDTDLEEESEEDDEVEESEDEESEDEDSEEESEDEEESEEDEDSFDEDDPSTWVGYSCKAKPKTTKAIATYQVVKFDAKKKLLSIKSSKGSFTITPEEVIDWVE